MSVLTKLFVVLLVVSSLLLSAAVVVFVNRVEDFKTQSEGAKVKLTSAVRHAQELDTVVADQRKAFETLQGQMSSSCAWRAAAPSLILAPSAMAL